METPVWSSGGLEGRLTLVLPAWRAAKFIGDTLDDLLVQSLREFSLVVTVDGDSDDGTVERVVAGLKRVRRIWRTEVWTADQRLGWVENTNRGLRLVRTRRVCIMPHDDRVPSGYLAALENALEANPGAVVASCDMRMFGGVVAGAGWRTRLRHFLPWRRRLQLPGTTLLEDQRTRTRTFLTRLFPAVAFRGLIDREVAGHDWLIDHGSGDDFAADTTWLFKLALAGPMVGAKGAVYRKRMRRQSAHATWLQVDPGLQRTRWIAHCRDCRAVLARIDGETRWPEARRWLLARLWQINAPLWAQARWHHHERTEKRAAAAALFATPS
jgi:glycosyltransferase involved in cell wall biosynthesis